MKKVLLIILVIFIGINLYSHDFCCNEAREPYEMDTYEGYGIATLFFNIAKMTLAVNCISSARDLKFDLGEVLGYYLFMHGTIEIAKLEW